MKIAQITYSGFGGLGSVVFSLVGADQNRVHEWFVGFIGDQPLDGAYHSRCDKYEVKYAAFQSTPGKPYRAWWDLKRWLDHVQPDVIICHSINSVLACRWHTLGRAVPLIVVEHTSNLVKTRNEWFASRIAMLVADRVVTLTSEYRAELYNAHGWIFRTNKVKVIPNGIDTTEFSPAKHMPLKASPPIRLGMAARFSFSKRQDLLVEMMEVLHAMRPDLLFELYLAGQGEEWERVRALADSSCISHRIHFVGLINETDIASWMRGLDVYLHATSGESFCLSVLQAMATALPVIASKNVGIAVLKEDDSTGFLVENISHLWADKLLSLHGDMPAALNMGKHARQVAVENYGSNKMLEAYLDLIREAQT